MAYIQPFDLSGIVSADTEAVLKWITKAEVRLGVLVRQRGTTLAALAADPDSLEVLRDVLENAVLRVLRNPEGLKSESEGDYSVTLNPLDAAGNIWFPAADLDALCPVTTGRFGTLQLGLTALQNGLRW